MNEQIHNKLVRNGIPAKIEANGEAAHVRILTKEEFLYALIEKSAEELRELVASLSLEERADLEEVLRALDNELGFSAEQIEAARAEKYKRLGGFEQRVFLEKTTAGSDQE